MITAAAYLGYGAMFLQAAVIGLLGAALAAIVYYEEVRGTGEREAGHLLDRVFGITNAVLLVIGVVVAAVGLLAGRGALILVGVIAAAVGALFLVVQTTRLGRRNGPTSRSRSSAP